MDSGPSGHVVWGPFPVAWGWVVGFALLLTFGAGLLRASGPQRLTCARAGPEAAVTCALEGQLGGVTRLTLAAAAAEIVTRRYNGRTRAPSGILTLTDVAGRAVEAWDVPPETAQAQAAELARFLGDSTEGALELVRPSHAGMASGGVLCLVAGLVGLALALRHAGRFRFTWDPAGRVLTRTRLLFGLSLRTRRFSWPEAVGDVSVALREPPPPARRKRPPAFRPAGQLRAISGGREVPLSEAFKPGVNLHLRAAEGLRALLACRGVEATRATEASAQAVIVSAIRAERVAGRVAAVWAGVCGGAVLAGLPALFWLAPEGEEVPSAVVVAIAAGALAGLLAAFALSRPDRPIP